MSAKRLLVFVAFVLELLAAVGFAELHLGTISVSLIAAGLAAYFFAEFV